ncbi:hypothetical protein BJX70DRAFT_404762 [Aspergillus crustosus]
MGASWAFLLLYTSLIGITSGSPLKLPLSVPKILPRADTSSDPSCPDGFFCEQSECPDDVICPEGGECINFEGYYACAPPKVMFCALNPSNLEAVGCDSGICCHGNCYSEDAECCDFPDTKCTIGKLCNACSPNQKCGDNKCTDSNPTSTTSSSTSTAAPPVETTSASTSDSTSTETSSSSGTSSSSETSSETSSSETSSSETSSSSATPSPTSSTTTSGQPTPTTVSDIDDFSVIDCLADSINDRVLVGDDDESSSEMTPEQCVKFAQDGGWNQCFVGNTLHTEDKDNNGCDMPCTGDKEKLCGGEGRIQVYEDSSWKNPTLEELANGIRDITASIDSTRKAISTYHDHLEELQDLMGSPSNTHAKRDDNPYQDFFEMKILKDQAAIQAALDDLVAAQSETQRLLTIGQELDTLDEANPNVPYSTLQEFESSTDDLMQQVNNAMEDINANVEELSSAIASGIEPAIEVGTSLATIQTAITSIGLPTTIAAGAATGIFVVMTSLLALFAGGSDEPADTSSPDEPSCDQKSTFRAVVILFKEKTSLSDFKELVEGFPEDKEAMLFTDEWQPNDYADRIIKTIALEGPSAPPAEEFRDHGTCMTSLAAGSFSGIAKDARIVLVDLLAGPQHQIARTFALLRLIYQHAMENNGFGNSVVSMSFSIAFGMHADWEEAGITPPVPGSTNCFDTMFGWFWAQGISTVTGAGNYEDDPDADERKKDLATGFPRSLGGATRPLIVVGNMESDDERAPSSVYKDSSNSGILTLYNQGTDIECATLDSEWMAGITGTSGAAALTAGLIAHYLSQPDLKAQFQEGGLRRLAMKVKKYVLDQSILYKGLRDDDGIPRAALGDLVPCSSEDAIQGPPGTNYLNFESEDHTLRTEVVTQGMSIVMEDMPECRVFGLSDQGDQDAEDDQDAEGAE